MDEYQLRNRLELIVEVAMGKVNPLVGNLNYSDLPYDVRTGIDIYIDDFISDFVEGSNDE